MYDFILSANSKTEIRRFQVSGFRKDFILRSIVTAINFFTPGSGQAFDLVDIRIIRARIRIIRI